MTTGSFTLEGGKMVFSYELPFCADYVKIRTSVYYTSSLYWGLVAQMVVDPDHPTDPVPS